MGSRIQGGWGEVEGVSWGGEAGILNGSGMSKYRGERGPGRATASEWRLPGLSPVCENPPDKKSRTRRCEDLEKNQWRLSWGYRGDRGTCDGQTPKGLTGTWAQAKVVKGGVTVTGNGSRLRQTAQGAETRSGGWQVAGAGDVQVDGAFRQESMWGACENR